MLKIIWNFISNIFMILFSIRGKKDKELLAKFRSGKPMKMLDRIELEILFENKWSRIKRECRSEWWFLKKELVNLIKISKRSFCKHKHLSEPKWELINQKGYRYCYNCWKDIYDEELTVNDCNLIEEIGI